MATKDYLFKIAEATERDVWTGLSFYVYLTLKGKEKEQFASDLAVSVASLVLVRKAATPEIETFRANNGVRIEQEARRLSEDKELCELLSGAAYNVGYARYVLHGGSMLFNRFLRFIRDGAVGDGMEPFAVEHIRILQRLGLWIPRVQNPNELDYFKAIQAFAVRQNSLVK